jgi:hypothetical protein
MTSHRTPNPSSTNAAFAAASVDGTVVARAHRRARTAALHSGPSIGLDFDPTTGTYRIAVSRTI